MNCTSALYNMTILNNENCEIISYFFFKLFQAFCFYNKNGTIVLAGLIITRNNDSTDM